MKLRTYHQSALLLLLPALVVAAGVPKPVLDASVDTLPTRVVRNAKSAAATVSSLPPQVAGTKPTSPSDLGTKDAPVDGKDGKPHAGPFVDSDRKKPKPSQAVTEIEDIEPSTKTYPKEKTVDGKPIPEVNDGVMNDQERVLPKDGTTGTEGGVSEKDKARKAHEGQTGEKLEKTPESPKEAPPLPHSEQELIKGEAEKAEKEAKKSKSKDTDVDDTSDLAGFEVGHWIRRPHY
jgi:hypothetical protein